MLTLGINIKYKRHTEWSSSWLRSELSSASQSSTIGELSQRGEKETEAEEKYRAELLY